jgi:uncharacterized protein YcfL
MKSVRLKSVACLALTAGCQLLFSGCSTRTAGLEANASSVAAPAPSMDLSQFVVMNSRYIANRVEVVDMKSALVGDLMKANVTLSSKTSSTLKLQYQFAWFNAQGMEINPEAATWTPLIIYGRETKTVQGVGPNPSAKAFKVKLRDNN